MPSSTSNSETETIVRAVPDKPWLAMFGAALVLVAAAYAGWEMHVRSIGYGPTYDDKPNIWVPVRARAEGAKADQVVFVGASRTLFDMDLTAFQKEVGGPLPIQLATVGSNPLVIFEDLAHDPNFAGTVIFGVVPGLVASAAGPPVANPAKFVKKYHNWSPADSMELPLTEWFDAHLAFVNQEELTLSALIDSLDLPLRPNVYAPRLPGYMHTIDLNRQGRMLDSVAHDPKALHDTQQIWMPLFHGPPKPKILSQEEWDKILIGGWETNLEKLKKGVAALTARGGNVLFSRLPSTEGVRQVERETVPRPQFWDRILRETGMPGIHFEDYPELKDFQCPEWSHLSASDATLYTQRFARILKAKELL